MKKLTTKEIFKQLPPALQKDRDILFEAIKGDPSIVHLVETSCLDRGHLIVAAESDGTIIKGFRDSFKTEDVLKAAVRSNGLALQYINSEQRNEGIIMFALFENGLALGFLSKEERCHDRFIRAALNSNGLALQFLHQDKLEDIELSKLAVASNGEALKYVPAAYRDIPEIIELAINSGKLSSSDLPKRVRCNKALAIQALKKAPEVTLQNNSVWLRVICIGLMLYYREYMLDFITPYAGRLMLCAYAFLALKGQLNENADRGNVGRNRALDSLMDSLVDYSPLPSRRLQDSALIDRSDEAVEPRIQEIIEEENNVLEANAIS